MGILKKLVSRKPEAMVVGMCLLFVGNSSALFVSVLSAQTAPEDTLPRFSKPIYSVEIQNDVDYLGTNRTEKCDLYLPENLPLNSRVPGIVIIHGGGWMGGDKGDTREMELGTTLAKYGYVCMSINYLLAESGSTPTWPQNIYDCKSAVQFLRSNADALHIDPSRIGAIGGSAGGHLVSMLGTTVPADGLEPPDGSNVSSRVQAVVDLYGIANIPEWLRSYLVDVFGNDPETLVFASPINHVTGDDAAFLIMHGLADQTVPYVQSIEFVEKLASNAVPARLVLIGGAPHTFHLYDPEYKNLMLDIVDFFDEHLKYNSATSPITQIVDDFNSYESTTELRDATEPHSFRHPDGTTVKFSELSLDSTQAYEGSNCLSVQEDTSPEAWDYCYGPDIPAGTNGWDFSGLNTFRTYLKKGDIDNGIHGVTLYLQRNNAATESWIFTGTINTVGGRPVSQLPEWTAVEWDLSGLSDAEKSNITRILFRFYKEKNGDFQMYMDQMGGL